MGLTQFVKPVRYPVILSNCSMLFRLYALVLTPPLAVSLIVNEYTYSLILGLLWAGSLLIGLFKKFVSEENMTSPEALITTALAYVLYALASGLVFLPVTSYMNGFFEAMSGFTTTGLSMLDPDRLPWTLLFFRAYTQWIGGAGIIVLSLIILIGPGKNAFQLYTSEFREENLAGNVRQTARIVARVYLILTASGYIVYVAAGMGYSEALLHILTTVSTGGFATHGKSIGHYPSHVLQMCVVLFMLAGAVGFPSYYLLWRQGIKRFFRDIQLRSLLLLAGSASLIFLLADISGPRNLWASIFNAVSALTTTGFNIGKTSRLPGEILFLSAILMIMGGSAGSTAGGLKLFRVNVMLRLPKWLILRVLLPQESKISVKYSRLAISETELKQILGFTIAYVMLLAGSIFIFCVYGFSITDSFFESASALGTVGLSVGVTSPSLPGFLKGVLILDMWAGRVEVLPLLILFYFKIWIPKGKKS